MTLNWASRGMFLCNTTLVCEIPQSNICAPMKLGVVHSAHRPGTTWCQALWLLPLEGWNSTQCIPWHMCRMTYSHKDVFRALCLPRVKIANRFKSTLNKFCPWNGIHAGHWLCKWLLAPEKYSYNTKKWPSGEVMVWTIEHCVQDDNTNTCTPSFSSASFTS